MAVLVFQHAPSEGPGTLGRLLLSHGLKLRVLHLHAGDAVPGDLDDVDAVLSLGGPMNVEDAGSLAWIAQEAAYLKRAHEASIPLTGICLGAQLIAHALGGKVAAMPAPEVGFGPLKLQFAGTTDTAFTGIPWNCPAFHLHGQQVTELPPGAALLASTPACKNQAFRVGMSTYAFQYHFEWDDQDLRLAVKDGLVQRAGKTPEQLLADLPAQYDGYRRLGDRLCKNLVDYLFAPQWSR